MNQWVSRGAMAAMAGLMSLAACGGGADVELAEAESTSTGSEQPAARRDDGVQIQGLMGTMDADDVRNTLEPKLGRFMRCFSRRYDDIEILGGHIHMGFRVDVEGNVLWVYPTDSSIGDRQTEKCLLDTAAAIRFPRPRGGEAEFGYPLHLDPPEDVRPPVHWEASSVASTVEANRGTLSSCGAGYTVTVYIAPGGQVMAVGASSEQTNAEGIDCVTEAVSGWAMPDPGSYPAKVSFSL